MIQELAEKHIKIVKVGKLKLPDISDLLDKIAERNIDPTVFLDSDEGDIPKAPNCVKFYLSRKFLNLKPLPKQLEISLKFFEEYCPLCSDPNLMNNMFDQSIPEILDKVQLLHFGKCPKCKATKWELHEKGYFNFPHSLRGCAGQRSGKSLLADDFMLPYMLHRYLTCGEKGVRITPQNYFGLLPTTILQITATALTVEKSLDLIWKPFAQTLKKSPWFIEYHKYLNTVGKEKGEQLYLEGSTFFFYIHKLISGGVAAPDFGKLRGPTRIVTLIDEIDYFDTDEESKKSTLSAEEISTSLNNSLRTIRNKANKFKKIRPHWLSAYDLSISSPSSFDGKILRDIRKAEASKLKRVFAFHYATWEMNPDYSFDDFEEDFETDPIRTWRDFGAVPPLAGDNPFHENIESIKKSMRKEPQDLLSYQIKYSKDKIDGSISLYAEVKINYTDKIPRLMTIDKGHSVNSFSIILSHIEADNKPYIDYVISIRPEKEKNKNRIKINTNLVFEHAIKPLLEGLWITMVVYDRWESLDSVRKIRDEYGIEAEQYSLQPKDFEEVISPVLNEVEGISYPKSLIDVGKLDVMNYSKDFGGVDDIIKAAKKCPVSLLVLQILTVRKIGRKVVKPLTGDDDAFRSLSLSIVYLKDEEKNFKFKGSGRRNNSSHSKMGSVLCYSVKRNSDFKGIVSGIGRCTLHKSFRAVDITNGKLGRVVKQKVLNN